MELRECLHVRLAWHEVRQQPAINQMCDVTYVRFLKQASEGFVFLSTFIQFVRQYVYYARNTDALTFLFLATRTDCGPGTE